MPEFSSGCINVLQLLKDRHNVLISGAPGTGKSRLLNEIARAFLMESSSGPVHVPGSPVAIPKSPPVSTVLRGKLPSDTRNVRKVFRTVFHQNSKYRDFVTGLVPVLNASGSGSAGFRVTEGTLYRASQHSMKADGAALLIIDEINRGPAVQIFGGSIVAIESDKRLDANGMPGTETQYFELLNPVSGELIEYALPHHLYIVAAMNQADTSVEPLDVAFLRRWAPYNLLPDAAVLREFLGLPPSNDSVLPERPEKASEVYEAAVQAWENINVRIRLGRGAEFQIGHGILMAQEPSKDLEKALRSVAESWSLLRAHIDEVFFSDLRGIAEVLNVGSSVGEHPYKLEDRTFADEPRLELVGPRTVDGLGIYQLLRAIAE